MKMSRFLGLMFGCIYCCAAHADSKQGKAPVPTEPPIEPAVAAPDSGAEPVSAESSEAVPNSPMTSEFQGDEIGLVLRALAKQAGVSIVVSDKVQGTVTMRLEHRSPKDALEVIVKAKELDMEEQDGVYFIKTQAERALEPSSRQLERAAKDLAGPVAHFKGQYYKSLLEEGLPQNLAEELVRQETMSTLDRYRLRGNGSIPVKRRDELLHKF